MNKSLNYRVIDILKMSTDYLQKKGIENPRLNVELLLGHVLKMNRVQLYLSFEKPLQASELDQFRAFLKRRSNHEPIQYIIGETEFYSLKFKVNRYTLIPRPETEILVDKIIEICNKTFSQLDKIIVLDIGSGCGNIAISLAKNIQNAYILGIDINAETVKTASENAQIHNVEDRIRFKVADVFKADFLKKLTNRFDIIVSNPPYVSQEEYNTLPIEVKNFEPYIALNGGEDGLTFYRWMLQISKDILRPDGIIGFEIGYNQGKLIKEVALKLGFKDVEIFKDLNKIDRVIIAWKANFR
jgi:release factor glutamine methyltransferase